MTEREVCGYTPGICKKENSACSLASLVENQAKTGSFPNPDLSKEDPVTKLRHGKYWPAKIWYEFTKRATKVAQEEGCLNADTGELEDYVNLVTGMKERDGSVVHIDYPRE